jgi:hypothetical protein
VQTGAVQPPALGTDGVIEAYQTFERDPKAERSYAEGGRIEGGVMKAGPFELAIPIAIFDVAFTLHVHGAMFRFTIDEDRKMHGQFGGGIEVAELIDGVKDGAGLDDIIPAVQLALNAAADLAPDENAHCTQVSATLAFDAVPAFIRE